MSQYTIFGHDVAYQRLCDAFDKNKLHNSLLISGPLGIGKTTFAFGLMHYMLKTESHLNSDAFDHKFQSRAISDMKIISNVDNDKSQAIKIADTRDLNVFFRLAPAQGKYRVALIDDAHHMTVDAQNSLLKILEEPPKNCFIILVSHLPSKLLKTILSRVQQVKLQPLALPEFTQAFNHLCDDDHNIDAQHYYDLLGGRIGEALRWHAQEGLILSDWFDEFINNHDSCQKNLDDINNLAIDLGQSDHINRYHIFCYIINQYIHQQMIDMALNDDEDTNHKLRIYDDVKALLSSEQAPLYLNRQHIILQVLHKLSS